MGEGENTGTTYSSLCMKIVTSEQGDIWIRLAMPYSADVKLKGILREKGRLETCS